MNDNVLSAAPSSGTIKKIRENLTLEIHRCQNGYIISRRYFDPSFAQVAKNISEVIDIVQNILKANDDADKAA